MDMSIGLSQAPTVSHQLSLAPQLLQWLKLLQSNSLELSQAIRHELETNPVLEAEPSQEDGDSGDTGEAADRAVETDVEAESPSTDGTVEAYFDDSDMARRMEVIEELGEEWREDLYAEERAARANDENDSRRQYMMDSITASSSLGEHLARQVSLSGLDEKGKRIAEIVIGSLDRGGYLTLSTAEIAAMAGVTPTEVAVALNVVKRLDPPGIAARDLQECLLLQLDKETEPLAYSIVRDCFDLLSRRAVDEIAERLPADDEEIRDAMAVIMKLNPMPGQGVAPEQPEYVTPDVIITRDDDGKLNIEVNSEFVPSLRISAYCRKLLSNPGKSGHQDIAYLRRKMRSAMFLIQGISQRQETLKRVATEIVRVQKDFFEDQGGEICSLTMARVASVLGVHETTVSRAISGKYVRTPRGLFEMRHFFKAGYSCADGSALSTDQVKNAIGDIVDGESQGKPLTDLDIAAHLKTRGLKVARRTIAKYREEMNIPSSKERILFSFPGRPAAEPESRQALVAV